jgi:Cupredoxin-like domain
MHIAQKRLKNSGLVVNMLIAGAIGIALTTGASAAAPLPVRIVLHDHGFGFHNIGFRANKVRLTVINRGKRPHGLAIGAAEPSSAGTFARTKLLAPGQSTKISLSLHPGNYRMFSPVDHDRQHGLSVPLKVMSPTPKQGAETDRVFYDYRQRG